LEPVTWERTTRIYSEIEDVRLIGISDPNYSRVKELAARHKRTCSKIQYTTFCRSQKDVRKNKD